jgi:hypothetical protein
MKEFSYTEVDSICESLEASPCLIIRLLSDSGQILTGHNGLKISKSNFYKTKIYNYLNSQICSPGKYIIEGRTRVSGTRNDPGQKLLTIEKKGNEPVQPRVIYIPEPSNNKETNLSNDVKLITENAHLKFENKYLKEEIERLESIIEDLENDSFLAEMDKQPTSQDKFLEAITPFAPVLAQQLISMFIPNMVPPQTPLNENGSQ